MDKTTRKSTDKELTETLILNGERVSVADMKRFWQERPAPDFSAERNAKVIASSIARAEAHRLQMRKEQHEGLRERASALTSYIKYLDHGGVQTADKYFGRKELARLQGAKTIQRLQKAQATGQPYWQVISTE